MSQQMEYEEGRRNYQGGYSAPGTPQSQGIHFDDHFAGFSGQKIGQFSGPAPSAGQRLALAIVSLVTLVVLTSIILGITMAAIGGFFGLSGGLVGLALVCVAIIAINAVFSRHN
ncbi:MAG TPA: hypothetical protein VKV40_15065 [Ktedonobacteraceae bacterium]|nr:hypothetical protein [Ktedonobacteraceae bacterium]